MSRVSGWWLVVSCKLQVPNFFKLIIFTSVWKGFPDLITDRKRTIMNET
ncbi:MAG: hypothetical protein RL021_556, partial [Bacteroidota bacterium]